MRIHYIKDTYGGLLCEFGYLNLTNLSKFVLTRKKKPFERSSLSGMLI